MKLYHIVSGVCLGGALVLSSCTTDFELNAPYEAEAVVYGFVEPLLDTQYVKINKSFLGDGNNTSYAAINDSTIFPNVAGTVDMIVNGTVSESYVLQEKYFSDLEEGIFYEDSQKIYYWVPTSGIDVDATYQINLDINEGAKTVTAETGVVGNVDFKSIFKNKVLNINGVSLSNTSAPGNNVYNDLLIEWGVAQNGKRYQVKLVFNYEEHHANSDVFVRTISTTLGSQVSESSTVDFLQNYNGENFYAFVANRLADDPNEATIVKRVPIGLEFHIVVADENLHTYMEVNEPANGIITEKPVFTNVSGGIGLFASRNTTILDERNTNGDPIVLSFNSEKELVYGQYTSNLKFCSQIHATDPDIGCQ